MLAALLGRYGGRPAAPPTSSGFEVTALWGERTNASARPSHRRFNCTGETIYQAEDPVRRTIHASNTPQPPIHRCYDRCQFLNRTTETGLRRRHGVFA